MSEHLVCERKNGIHLLFKWWKLSKQCNNDTLWHSLIPILSLNLVYHSFAQGSIGTTTFASMLYVIQKFQKSWNIHIFFYQNRWKMLCKLRYRIYLAHCSKKCSKFTDIFMLWVYYNWYGTVHELNFLLVGHRTTSNINLA